MNFNEALLRQSAIVVGVVLAVVIGAVWLVALWVARRRKGGRGGLLQ